MFKTILKGFTQQNQFKKPYLIKSASTLDETWNHFPDMEGIFYSGLPDGTV